MNNSCNRFALVIITIFLVVGSIQYIFSAIGGVSSVNSEVFFMIDDDLAGQAGLFRYLKDATIVIFGVIWPFFVPKSQTRILSIYAIWIVTLLLIGSIALLTGKSYFFFYIAGLRWLLLLHAAFGLFLMVRKHGLAEASQNHILSLLIFLLSVNAFFFVRQAGGGSFSGLRLPGMFSNAGTAGYFASGLCILTFGLQKGRAGRRWLTNGLCLFDAIGSGTRFAILSVLAISCFSLVLKFSERLPNKSRAVFLVTASVGVIPGVFGFIAFANSIADRGDLIIDQIGEGGRLYNLNELFRLIVNGNLLDVLIGQGLGVGTNTAFAASLVTAYNSDIVSWNILIDNSFATTFVQLGLIGSILFWGGIIAFFASNLPFRFTIISFVFLLALTVQNISEQYFMVISFALAVGLMSRYNKRLLRDQCQNPMQRRHAYPT